MLLRTSLISLTLLASYSAEAKDLTCYWTEGGTSVWDIREIHGLSFEEQLDGSQVVFQSVWKKSLDESAALGTNISKSDLDNVSCHFDTDSVLTRCTSEQSQTVYQVNLVSETSLNYDGSKSVFPGTEISIKKWPARSSDLATDFRHRVTCKETAIFESIVENLLRIR